MNKEERIENVSTTAANLMADKGQSMDQKREQMYALTMVCIRLEIPRETVLHHYDECRAACGITV